MRHTSTRLVRRTWAAVTANPAASARQLADDLGIGGNYTNVSLALRVLVAAGYIGERPARGAPRPIYLPFVVGDMKL